MDNLRNKIETPFDELNFLREQAKMEQSSDIHLDKQAEEKIILDKLMAYHNNKTEAIIAPSYELPANEIDKIVLNLVPEKHDSVMESLLGILEEKGIKNALSVVEKMNNPHLEDDFHRVLVQYIKNGYLERVSVSSKKFPQELKMTLYEILLPELNQANKEDVVKLISPMEHFYAGMLSLSSVEEKNYFVLEIATSSESEDLVIYASVPDSKKDLFQKHLLSFYPGATMREKTDDYNVFNDEYCIKGLSLSLQKESFFTIKTVKDFNHDPLSVILNSFSKLNKSEGASIQFIFDMSENDILKEYEEVERDLKKGVSAKDVFRRNTFSAVAADFFLGRNKKEDIDPTKIDQNALENLKEKISSPICRVNIRLVISAQEEGRAESILNEISSSLNQFEKTTGNKFVAEKLKGSDLKKMLHNFSFRVFDIDRSVILNLKELATLMHFSSFGIKSFNILKQLKSVTAPAPNSLAQEGVLLGVNNHQGEKKFIYMNEEDRLRHFYIIGQTGTGKTTFLKNIIRQDILNGEGVCLIDPHGYDIDDILGIIPPERYEDVIYFDPSHTARPFALNMLEYDIEKPEQKTFVVNEMLSIFDKLFDMKTVGGPMFEQYFRQAVLLTIDSPESGNTLADVSRVLYNKDFRDKKLALCRNPHVVQFWKEVAEKAGGEAALQNIVPYITSKFDIFLSNEIMGPIVSQPKSSLDFKKIMNEKKILLVNLSKGKLGEINSKLIGLIVVGKIVMTAFSRADLAREKINPFYLYIDEFQNFTTDSVSVIFSEARKYKLSLTVAHQYIKQLSDKIRESVFGNVGSMAIFRVGMDDAEYIQKQFEPIFSAKDIVSLENRNAYLKMLVNGQPANPFNIETLAPEKPDEEKARMLKELSYLKFGGTKN